MNHSFLKDKYTKSYYSFVEKNRAEVLDLNEKEIIEIDNLHEETKMQLLTFYENVNFNLKIDPSKFRIKISTEDLETLKTKPLFTIHTKDPNNCRLGNESPYNWFLLRADEVRYSVYCLDIELKNDNFFDFPIDWLIKMGIILPSKCCKCLSDHEIYQIVDDTIHWQCKNKECPTKLVELCGHFHYCTKAIKELPLFIYNWAIHGYYGLFRGPKSSFNKNLDNHLVRLAFNSIEQICKKTNEFYVRKLGENGKKVDLFSCTFSNLVTIFALEIETSHIKFKVLDDSNFHKIVSILKDWFDPDINLVVYEAKFKLLKKYFKNVEKREDFDNERLNSFFHKITELYQNNTTFRQLDREKFSLTLHVIIWRLYFGKTPYSAFKFIVSLITNQPCEYDSNLLNFASKAETSVVVEEFFYGKFDYIIQPLDLTTQSRNNVRCHTCYVPFNFDTFFSHISKHFTPKTQKRIISSYRNCSHCFAKFDFMSFQTHRSLLEGNFNKKELISACKICCIIFKSKLEYIDHLKLTHRYQDHPFSCELCPFRSSFYHEKVQHYKTNHSNVIRAYCKYCLKLFTEENSCSELVADHLQEHLRVKNEFKCPNCSLSFISQQDFEKHFQDDHIIQLKKAINFSLIKYKVDETCEGTILKLKLPKNNNQTAPINTKRRVTRDGRSHVKLTKKNHFMLKFQGIKHDSVLCKDFLLIADNLVICLECSQPIDANHFSKREIKCTKCNFKGFCAKSISYPCNLHMSGKI